MISVDEFRESYINEDINAQAVNTSRYPIEVFIENAVDILQNDYLLVGGMEQCYYEYSRGSKSMRIDAAYLDLPANTLNLLYADYNSGAVKSITNTFISAKSRLLLNFLVNSLKGHFANAELSDPAVQLARNIKANFDYIGKIHLFIISTDKLSSTVKKLSVEPLSWNGRMVEVVLDVLDIEKIYRSKMVGFKKEDIVICCEDYGIDGIPCIKADIDTQQYDSYLAIVPGKFLSDIYKKYSSSLLESNVRSFLKFNGGVNKGIRGTILNQKSRFFTYNNGISTTASAIEVDRGKNGELIITAFTNLQIINGGQTTATLAATSIKNNADLSGIFSNQVWYQENRAYRPQLIAYTFAKLVFVAQKVNKQINYRLIWDLQEVPSCIDEDIAAISKIAFDVMYDENRPTANIESYCKREECWTNVAKQNYTLSEDGYGVLITPAEKQEESVRAKKDQRIASGIEDELGIFRKGSDYWKSLAEKGKSQNVLSSKDLSIIDNAVKYCEFVYTSLYPKQVKEINIVLNKLKENGIE